MAAYWIAHVAVSDPEVYGEYAKRATDAIAAHGGEFLARATRTVWLEGNERERNVVVRFPSVESASAMSSCASPASRTQNAATTRPPTRKRSSLRASRPSATCASSKVTDPNRPPAIASAALPGEHVSNTENRSGGQLSEARNHKITI